MTERLEAEYPEYAAARAALEQRLLQMDEREGSRSSHLVVPVVVHVIHQYGPENLPKDTIQAAINQLNRDFALMNADTANVQAQFKPIIANMGIEFRLATKDPNGNCTDGIVRVASRLTDKGRDYQIMDLSRWDPQRYLNIWVVRNIGMVGNVNAAGYATYPPALFGYDGVVVEASYLNTRTLTHEAGHYFGLRHTFEGGCGVSGQNCTISGDRVCDTPPVQAPNWVCDSGFNSCSTDTPNLPDNVSNFMNYSVCHHMYTEGQKTRVHNTIQAYRSMLVSSANLIQTGTAQSGQPPICAPIADFEASDDLVCVGGTVQYEAFTYNGEATGYHWEFPGAQPATSTAASPTVTYLIPGEHEVTLAVSNSQGSDTVERDLFIHVLPDTASISDPIVENFEDEHLHGGKWFFSPSGSSPEWNRTNRTAATGSSSLHLPNLVAMGIGETYSFTLPPINVKKVGRPIISFKLAYAQRDSESRDVLQVLLSDNCGQFWFPQWSQSAEMLATVNDYKPWPFTPDASDFKEVSFDLFGLGMHNSEHLLVRFEFSSQGGNDIFIDDIKIGNPPVAVSEQPAPLAVSVYPMPVSQELHLALNTPQTDELSFVIRDMLGKVLYSYPSTTLPAGEQRLLFSREELNLQQSGYYLLEGQLGQQQFTRKLLITQP